MDDNSRQVERHLVLTRAGVIRIRTPMDTELEVNQEMHENYDSIQDIQPFPAIIYDGNDVSYGNDGSERTDTDMYFTRKLLFSDSNQIIGWTQYLDERIETMLFKRPADPSITDGAMNVFTDTIFPVLMQENWEPFEYNTIIYDMDRILKKTNGTVKYHPSIQLVLMDPKDDRQRIVRKAKVSYESLNNSETFKILDGYKADLRLFHSNTVGKALILQAIIGQILDKQSPNCPYVGLYAGPDLLPEKHRQCWPILKTDPKPQHITREQGSPFRHSGPIKRFVRRVGYLVSKQSLLCVCEHTSRRSPDHTQPIFTVKDDEHYFTRLLKDNTFCICDSRHTLLNKKHEVYEEIHFSPFFMPFRPKVVILPEGLNSIVIHDVETDWKQKGDYHYTVSQLSGQRLYVQNIFCLDWFEFQGHFDGKGQIHTTRFTSKAKRDYIHDNCLIHNDQLGANVCFSLIKSQKYGKSYEERYNVFAEVTVPDKRGKLETMFYYFKTIIFIWKMTELEKQGNTVTKRFYEFEQDHWDITNKYEVNDPRYTKYFQKQKVWIEINANNYIRIAHQLADKTMNKTKKLSSVSITKMLWKRDYSMVFR